MADLKISQLSDGGAAQAADEYVVARSGNNFRIDGASVAAAATSVGTLSSLTVSGDLTVDTSTLKVDSANNRVGVGTDTPDVRLDVVATSEVATFGSEAASNAYIGFKRDSTKLGFIGNSGGIMTGGAATDFGITSTGSRSLVFGSADLPRMSLDASGNLAVDGTTFNVDATNNRVGIGTASPSNTLSVAGKFGVNFTSAIAGHIAAESGSTFALQLSTNDFVSSVSGTRLLFGFGAASGNTTVNLLADYNGGLTAADVVLSIGNLGLGVTPSAWTSASRVLQIGGATNNRLAFNGTVNTVSSNAYWDTTNNRWEYIGTGNAVLYAQDTGAHSWLTAASGTADNPISFTQAMTLDASGNLLVGGTSSVHSTAGRGNIEANGSSSATLALTVGAVENGLLLHNGTDSYYRNYKNGYFAIWTNNTERARITSGGDFLVGKAATALGTAGSVLYADGSASLTRDAGLPLAVNRLTDDGNLVEFYQATALEGTISVSGNTVSYNAFAGSHWSQLEDGSKPEILRGTVMEALNDLCEWPGEQNERLPKCKVSDTAGSKKVYGVFMDWDNDWTETNDMYVTAVGAFICRISADVTVEQGDLLESNGDGTARVQADDVIRSSTIGKVTSTVQTHQYEDGTYCVPVVLYCG
jgi:hypothetical protein